MKEHTDQHQDHPSGSGTSRRPGRRTLTGEPASQVPGSFRVLVVCTGNICRSPMAEHVLRRAFEEAGLGAQVTVSSAGTGAWHVGLGAYPPAQRILAAAGYPTEHVARQITKRMVENADLVLAADRGHLRALRALTRGRDRVELLRSFDPAADGDDIPDPYGYPDEEYWEVLAMLKAAAPGVVEHVRTLVA